MTALEVEKVSKTFLPNIWWKWKEKSSSLAVEALKEVSLNVKAGEITGLIGPNGSGKTTLLKIITGLLTADSGGVKILGEEVVSSNANTELVGIVLGDRRSFFLPISGRENLLFFGKIAGLSGEHLINEIGRAAEWAGLTGALDRRVSTYSGGMITRLALARALAVKRPLLMLDEPTASLDYEMIDKLKDKIGELARGGAAILVTSHDLKLISDWCSRVYLIKDGEIERELAGDKIKDEIATMTAGRQNDG